MCTVLLSQHRQSIDDGLLGFNDVHEGFREGVTQLQLLIAADHGRCGLSFSWQNTVECMRWLRVWVPPWVTVFSPLYFLVYSSHLSFSLSLRLIKVWLSVLEHVWAFICMCLHAFFFYSTGTLVWRCMVRLCIFTFTFISSLPCLHIPVYFVVCQLYYFLHF